MASVFLPGAGQLLQKRWAAGLLIMGGFGACFLVFIAHVLLRIVRPYYELWDWSKPVPAFELRRMQAAIPFAGALLFYLLGLIDAFAATRRAGRAAQRPEDPAPLDRPE
ncbi:MAG: hypothetical protein JXR37_30865 [Kiritimatiellae bacterium]|nr:hypothetical protein [Kiritimatiellia bacterium]